MTTHEMVFAEKYIALKMETNKEIGMVLEMIKISRQEQKSRN